MSVTVNLCPTPKLQFNQNGAPLAGGKLFTYAAGTSTKQATYADPGGAVTNNNPIILDANGQCDCFLQGGLSYKLVLAPANDTDPPQNPYWTEDQVTGINQVLSTFGKDVGVANAYVVNLNPAITSYANGQQVVFDAGNTSTGASTLNVNGLGPKQVLVNGQATVANSIQAGQRYVVSYSSTQNAFLVLSSSSPAVQGTTGSFTGNVSVGGSLTVNTGAQTLSEAVVLSQLLIGNRKQVFTSNGSFTVPPGVTSVWISGCGGGAGGGPGGYADATNASYGAASGGAGGGGAGQVAYKVPLTVAPGDVLNIVIGAAGTGGTTAGGAATAGGNTTVTIGTGSPSITLAGGTLGSTGSAAYTNGTQASVGAGTTGAAAYNGGPGYGAAASYSVLQPVPGAGGNGGSSLYGQGGSGGSYSAGINAWGHGAGGGGGSGISNLSAATYGYAGGNGTPGLIIVEW